MAFTETLQVAASFVGLTGTELSKVEAAPFLTKMFSENTSMSDFVNTLFFSAVSVGAMLAVLQIARAGMLYMGSDAWGQKDKAKHLMQDAVIGLLLLLAIVLILRQINPQLLNLEVLDKVKNLPAQGGYIDDRVSPQTQIGDGAPCQIPGIGPGIMQGGTCRFGP